MQTRRAGKAGSALVLAGLGGSLSEDDLDCVEWDGGVERWLHF